MSSRINKMLLARAMHDDDSKTKKQKKKASKSKKKVVAKRTIGESVVKVKKMDHTEENIKKLRDLGSQRSLQGISEVRFYVEVL